MSDYIMNRESLKRHCEAMCKKFKDVPTSGIYSEHRLVLDLLEQTEWIPCSERLPASDEDVLVTNGRGMYIGWIDAIDKIWRVDSESEYFMYDIVAWMPLPTKPYKAESEDKDEN